MSEDAAWMALQLARVRTETAMSLAFVTKLELMGCENRSLERVYKCLTDRVDQYRKAENEARAEWVRARGGNEQAAE